MIGPLIWGLLVILLGVPFVLIWWRIADRWADDKHKRFAPPKDAGPAPTVVKRSDIEGQDR
ncbi:MAG: hypothetical protein IPJ41_00415 [Phycisphaerales bacterium]|nr:hypothetical protein [Phycisphaerales bacterium]